MPVTEQDALRAMDAFKVLGDQPELQAKAKLISDTYRNEQQKAGKPLFPEYQKQSLEKLQKIRNGITDSDKYGFDDETFRDFAQTFPDPEKRARYVNNQFLARTFQRSTDDIRNGGTSYRDEYAKATWGQPAKSDEDFRQKLAADFNIESEAIRAGHAKALKNEDYTSGISEFDIEKGADPAYKARKEHVAKQFEERHAQISSDLLPYRDFVKQTVSDLQATMGVDGATGTSDSFSNFGKRLASIKDDRIRGLVIESIIANGQGDKKDGQWLKKMGENLWRGTRDVGLDVTSIGSRTSLMSLKAGAEMGEGVPGEVNNVDDYIRGLNANRAAETAGAMFGGGPMFNLATTKPSQEIIDQAVAKLNEGLEINDLAIEIRNIADNTVDPASSDYMVMRGLYAATRSIPYTLTAFVPGGIAINSIALGEQAYQTLGRANPGMSRDQKMGISMVAGPIMGLLEQASLGIIKGKAPVLGRFLNQAVATKGSAVARFGVGAIDRAFLEMGQENLQDWTPFAIQGAISAVKEDVPDMNWDYIFPEEFWSQQGELFFAVLPLALIGAGVGSVKDYNSGRALISDSRELGFLLKDDARASEIADLGKAGKFDEAEAMLRDAMKTVGADTVAIQAARAKNAEARIADMKEKMELLEKGEKLGIIPMITPIDGGTGKIGEDLLKVAYEVRFTDGTSRTYPTFAEAAAARENAAGFLNFKIHSEIIDTINRLDSTQRVGRGASYTVNAKKDTLLDDKKSGRSSKEDIQNRIDEAKADNQSVDTPAADAPVDAPVDATTDTAKETEAEIDAGIDSELDQAYTATQLKEQEEDDVLNSFTILGYNSVEFKNGIWQSNITLQAGARWTTVIEEKIEGDTEIELRHGKRDKLVEKLRAFEEVSGNKLTRDVASDADLTWKDIKGAFGRLGISYFVSTWDTENGFQRSEEMRKMYDDLVASGLGGSFEGYAQFFKSVSDRAAVMSEMRANGALDSELESELARLVGYGEQGRYEQNLLDEIGMLREGIDPENPTGGPDWVRGQSAMRGESASKFDSAAASAFENSTDASFSVVHNATGYGGDTGNLGDYNAFLRSRSLLDLNEFRVNPRSNILFRPDRLYRVVNSEGYQDFLDSGVVRPNQVGLRGHTYSHLYAAVGATGARYKGDFVIEMVPEAGQWEFVGAGYARNAAAKIDATGPVRVFRAIEGGSFEVVHDNIGDAAFLEENGNPVEQGEGSGPSFSVIRRSSSDGQSVTTENPVLTSIAGVSAADIFQSAKKRHGVTRSIYEAGYVLPDGTLLDFSGRADAGGFKQLKDLTFVAESGRDYMRDQRQVDHRDIEWEGMPQAREQSDGMIDFLRLGAIRIDANSGMISMHSRAKPSGAQLSVLKALVVGADGAYMDLEDDSGVRASIQLEGGKFAKVKGLINQWASGENPEYEGVSFSVISNAQDAEYLALAKDPVKNRSRLQRMVDAVARMAGYNIGPVFHGTTSKELVGNKFDEDFVPYRGGILAFFAQEKSFADGYAKNKKGEGSVYAVYLKAGNILSFQDPSNIQNFIESFYNSGNKINSDDAARLDLPLNATQQKAEVLERFMVGDWLITEADELVEWANKSGYDAIMMSEGGSNNYGVFNPSQIKSADPVTYDANGNVIPLSQRFNPESDSISYSVISNAQDAEYLNLAKDPEANQEKLREMADQVIGPVTDAETTQSSDIQSYGYGQKDIDYYQKRLDAELTEEQENIEIQKVGPDQEAWVASGRSLDPTPDEFLSGLKEGLSAPTTVEAIRQKFEVERKSAVKKIEEAKSRQLPFVGRNRETLFKTGEPTTVRVFHATPFGRLEKFDPDKLGSYTGAPSATKAHFFAGERRVSETYLADDSNYLNHKGFLALTPEQQRILVDTLREEAYANGVDDIKDIDPYEVQGIAEDIFPEIEGYDADLVDNQVHEIFLKLQNPLVIDYKGSGYREQTYFEALKEAEDAGHDGVIFANTTDPGPSAPFEGWAEPTNIFALLAGNENQIKSADPVTYDESGNVIPLSQRFNPESDSISYSVISSKFLRDDPRFAKLKAEGRLETGVDVNNFTGLHTMLHSPDMAFSGVLTLDGNPVIIGKGGAYYPIMFADDNYFWASTKNTAKATAAALNEISRKNGGKAVMALLSAPVEKLFSSTTMSTGMMNFFYNMSKKPKLTGITRAGLNSILINASKIKSSKGKTFTDLTLLKKDSLEDNIAKLEAALLPDPSTFDLRLAFVQSISAQIAKTVTDKKQAAYVAKVLLGNDNKFALGDIRKGKLAMSSIMQAMGHHLAEPFLRDFQEFKNGSIYAVIEVDGEVEAVPSDKHESYPFAIVPKKKGAKVKVSILKDAYDWQDVVGHEKSGFGIANLLNADTKQFEDYEFKDARKKLMPTGGMSTTALKFLGPNKSAAPSREDIGFSVIRNADQRIAEMFTPLMRDPSKKLEIVRNIKARFESEAEKFIEIANEIRTVRSLDREQQSREGIEYSKLIEDTFGAKTQAEQDALPPVDRAAARSEAKKIASDWRKKQNQKLKGIDRELLIGALRSLDAMTTALPMEIRGKIGGVLQLANFKTPAAMFEELERRAGRVEKEIEKWLVDHETKRIEKLFDKAKVTKTSKGIVKSNLPADVVDEVERIKKLSELSKKESDDLLADLTTKLDESIVDVEREVIIDDMIRLLGFGHIAGMNSDQLTDFGDNLESLISKGRLIKQILDEVARAEVKRLSDIVNNDVTGGKGSMTSSEAKRRAKLNEKIKGLTGVHRRNLSFEWLMNGLSRENLNVGTLDSETHKELSTMVHIATHLEKRANLKAEKSFREFMSDLFGLKGVKLNKKVEEFGEEVEKTGVYRFDYGLTGRTTKKEMRVSNVEAVVNGTATPASLGISADEWNLVKIAYAEMVQAAKVKGSELKGDRIVRYEVENTGKKEELMLSQDQAVNLLMLYRQEELKESMIQEGYSEETMAQMENFLTPEAKQIRDWLSKYYDKNYDDLNRVFKRHNGVSLPKIDFYSPAVRKAQGTEKEMQINSQGGSAMTTTPSFFISRVKNFARVDQTVGAISIYASHVAQSNHYIAWADPMKKLRGVFGNPEVKKNIEDYRGTDLLKLINERMEWFADGGNRKAGFIRFLDSLRNTFTMSSLSFNWAVMIKQLTSLPAYAFDMPVKDFAEYSAKFMADIPANVQEMLETDYVKARFAEGYERDVIEGLRGDGGYIKTGLQIGMLSGKIGDIIPVIVGGWAAKRRAYDIAIRNGATEQSAQEQSILAFEMATDRAQQAGDLKDLSHYQGGGSLAKLFTMFKTSPRQYYANVYESLLDAKAGKKDAGSEFARRLFIGQVVLPLTFQAVSDLIRSGFNDPEDEDYEIANYVRAVILGPLNGLFIFGDFAELVASGMSDTKIWFEELPIFAGPTKVAQALAQFWQGDLGEGIDDLLRGMGKMSAPFTYYEIIRREIDRLNLLE
jgi:hypothetical protein